ncbi:hypothetical protein BGZ61DRAFT_395496 [Ilyonectria robusta]|uniref:uncharacterized protein n=1 Tax=Ilyonectria robusta TaxID=1079257 RepID=UPI001E8ED4E9|nr:uncharacterized protein BGZ61DRAFT_395496 [Ilyonectria robusta]KAH8680248.1 hypothetical protein BGZ61DRAFT_395496 [Ilyonectria robusta]
MLSIRVLSAGAKPGALRVPRPSPPTDNSMAQVKLIAAGLHQVVRKRASGEHYSVTGDANTPGIDGVGVNLSTGKLVYFVTPVAGAGSFAEYVNVQTKHMWEMRDDADPVQAAALMNPLMSSWLALKKRVDFLREGRQEGWSCLIMGATTMSGKLAIKVARHFGAAKVIGAGRDETSLKSLGLDSYVVLNDPAETTDFTAAGDVDVVLDYLYGPYVSAFLLGTKGQKQLTWVSIGGLAGVEAEIPSQELRRRDLTIRGSGIGSWNPREAFGEVPHMLKSLEDIHMDHVKPYLMEDVERAWEAPDGRVVFVTNEYSSLITKKE